MPFPFQQLQLRLKDSVYGYLGFWEKHKLRQAARMPQRLGGLRKSWPFQIHVSDIIVCVSKEDALNLFLRTPCGELTIHWMTPAAVPEIWMTLRLEYETGNWLGRGNPYDYRRRAGVDRRHVDAQRVLSCINRLLCGIRSPSIAIYAKPDNVESDLPFPVEQLSLFKNPYSILVDMCPVFAQLQLAWLKRRGFSSQALGAVPSMHCDRARHYPLRELPLLADMMNSAPLMLFNNWSDPGRRTLRRLFIILKKLMQWAMQNPPEEHRPRRIIVRTGMALRKNAQSHLVKRDIDELRSFLVRHIPNALPSLTWRLSIVRRYRTKVYINCEIRQNYERPNSMPSFRTFPTGFDLSWVGLIGY